MGKNVKSSPRLKPTAIKSIQTKSKTMTGNCAANIKVVVRVRPPNKRENDENFKNVIRIVDDRMLIFDPKEHSQAFFYHNVQQKHRDLLKKPNKNIQFGFDRIFGYESTNEELFENTTKNLIKSLMDGYNCSVFAYGATGAGKTHTMLGNNDNPGITYLTMTELFKAKQELANERKFDLCMTYIEVYNETVQDLLNPGHLLQLREDGKYGVIVSGVKTCKFENPNKLFTLLRQGNANRTQHPTDANAESSRSHAVFQVYIQMEIKATREVRAAKLSMIDLAGSERGSATGFTGARFTEGANINKSLLALGNCINSLADGHRHVPYRDSKLTRLLKDSLGGNCQTIMIANVSPSQSSYEDTYNTLKYASRAKKIKSNLKRNIVNVELRAGEYARIIENLRSELEQVKNELSKKPTCVNVDEDLLKQLMELFTNKKQVLEKIFHIECSESMVILRRQFKEEIDSHLSGLCSDTPEREDLQRRLTNMVDRFHRQEETFARELDDLKQSLNEFDNKIREFIKQHPEVEAVAEMETMKLAQAETEYQAELERKKSSFLEDELKHKNNLLEKTWQTLQPCYMQLRGLGYANDSTVNNYRTLVRLLQGFKNITWEENDSQTHKNTIANTTIVKDNQTSKRKINDENVNISDGTFVLESAKSKRLHNDEMMAKVHKSPLPTKPKMALKHRALIRNLKLMTSPKNGQSLKNVKKLKSGEAVGRPPFK